MNANGKLVVLAGALLLPIPSLGAGEIATAPESQLKNGTGVAMSFGGRYSGTAYGSRDSQANLDVELAQDGDQVVGFGFLHDGLQVNVGSVCGGRRTISAREIPEISGRQVEDHRIRAEFTINVDAGPRNIDVDITIDGYLSEDGQVIFAELRGDTPWPCSDVRLSAELLRQ
jgi:hypothetical protein